MCVSVCKCDECSFFNYCINMDFESVNKDVFILLLACKNQQKKTNKKNINNTRAQGIIIDNIFIALMKQFNLFPVARGMLTITHDQNIIYTSKYIYK